MEQTKCPVDVISLCSADGQLRPLRLRLEDEQNGSFRVDIEEVVSTREVSYVGVEATIFLCRATVFRQSWLFELKYSIRAHTWTLLHRAPGN